MPRRRAVLRALLAILGLSPSSPAAGEAGPTPAQRGRGELVAPIERVTGCEEATYEGPATHLYSNRPYRTKAPVPALAGLRFCRGARHGTAVWTLAVERATDLFALAGAVHALSDRGWSRVEVPVSVEAAGVPLDRLYRKRFEPGTYLVRQGFARTAIVVFWSPDDAHIAP